LTNLRADFSKPHTIPLDCAPTSHPVVQPKLEKQPRHGNAAKSNMEKRKALTKPAHMLHKNRSINRPDP